MRLQELQNQALQLSIGDRWRLVDSLLSSIQRETVVLNPLADLVLPEQFLAMLLE